MAERSTRPAQVHHFSHDPAITRFEPHVPRTNPDQRPAVWAIDTDHEPLYWFPRDCPRVTVWPTGDSQLPSFAATFQTAARRVHAIELAWLGAMTTAELWRYRFDADAFEPWIGASGQWISHQVVEPVSVEPVGDLLALHVEAGIELRAVPSLWPLRDLVAAGPWELSIVRMANARPRPGERGEGRAPSTSARSEPDGAPTPRPGS